MSEKEYYGLDMRCQMILDEYRDNLSVFQKMEEIVHDQLVKFIRSKGIYVNAIESRVKAEKSLAGKLELKGFKYTSLSDLTDIVGARVITFYKEEVDKVAALVEKLFDVDWECSVDKRKKVELDRFGYLSLHYICRIPESLYQDENCPQINEYRFEIQMRTALQHVWATMDHDTGYKSGVEIPKEYLRNLSRLAGLLELADEQFSLLRSGITEYRRKMRKLVSNGNFDEVPLNGDTFRSYLTLNPFEKLINAIAGVNQAEIEQDNLMRYLEALLSLDLKTLGDVERMKKECFEAAYQLALHQFAGTDLDIVTLSMALIDLCVVYIVKHGGGENELQRFYEKIYGTNSYNASRAKRTMEQVQRIKII